MFDRPNMYCVMQLWARIWFCLHYHGFAGVFWRSRIFRYACTTHIVSPWVDAYAPQVLSPAGGCLCLVLYMLVLGPPSSSALSCWPICMTIDLYQFFHPYNKTVLHHIRVFSFSSVHYLSSRTCWHRRPLLWRKITLSLILSVLTYLYSAILLSFHSASGSSNQSLQGENKQNRN